ncbi:MAG: NifU family protein [Desulfovibrio sp.]
MHDKVEAALEKVRPILQADGGDVSLVEVTEDGMVRVQLQGKCKGCPMSKMTLKNVVEKFILKTLPTLKGVEAVDDRK